MAREKRQGKKGKETKSISLCFCIGLISEKYDLDYDTGIEERGSK